MKLTYHGWIGALGFALALGCAQPAAEEATTEQAVRFSKRLLLVGPHQEAAVADFNKDGVLDIVSGAYWLAMPRARFAPAPPPLEAMPEGEGTVLDNACLVFLRTCGRVGNTTT